MNQHAPHRYLTATQEEMKRHREILAGYERQAAGLDDDQDCLNEAFGVFSTLLIAGCLLVIGAVLIWAVPL